MESKMKRKAICSLIDSRVFSINDVPLTQDELARDILGYGTRSSFQNVLNGKAGARSIDNLWQRIKDLYDCDDKQLFLLARVKEDYERILSVIKNECHAFDWVMEYWWTMKQPVTDPLNIDTSVLPQLPEDLYYLGMLLAYAYYREVPEEMYGCQLDELKGRIMDRILNLYPSLDFEYLKKNRSVLGDLPFSVGNFCFYLSGQLKLMRTFRIDNAIQPWESDTYWVSCSENEEESSPESFYTLKHISEEYYFLFHTELTCGTVSSTEPLGTVVIVRLPENKKLFLSIDNGEESMLWVLKMPVKGKMMLYDNEGELEETLVQVKTSPNAQGKYKHAWHHIIHKTVADGEFHAQLKAVMDTFFTGCGFRNRCDSKMLSCIRTQDCLFYRLYHLQQHIWIKIELSLYPELKNTLPSETVKVVKNADHYELEWEDKCHRIQLDGQMSITNQEIISRMGLDKE